MNVLKNAGINFWLNASSVLLTLIGTILLIVTNSTAGYELSQFGLGITFAVLSLVFACGAAYLVTKMDATHPIPSVLGLAVLVSEVIVIATLILGRANLAASLFTFDEHNIIGWGVFRVSVTAMVFFLLSSIIMIVGAFISKSTKESRN